MPLNKKGDEALCLWSEMSRPCLNLVGQKGGGFQAFPRQANLHFFPARRSGRKVGGIYQATLKHVIAWCLPHPPAATMDRGVSLCLKHTEDSGRPNSACIALCAWVEK